MRILPTASLTQRKAVQRKIARSSERTVANVTAAPGELNLAGLPSILTGAKHGPAFEPGNSRQSLLMQYIRGERTPRMAIGGLLPEETATATLVCFMRAKRCLDCPAPSINESVSALEAPATV